MKEENKKANICTAKAERIYLQGYNIENLGRKTETSIKKKQAKREQILEFTIFVPDIAKNFVFSESLERLVQHTLTIVYHVGENKL